MFALAEEGRADVAFEAPTDGHHPFAPRSSLRPASRILNKDSFNSSAFDQYVFLDRQQR